MEDSAIRLTQRPEFCRPILLAAWPGMGNVAIGVARYLIDSLGMEPLGVVESAEFSYAEGIAVKDQSILPLQIPEYRFYFHQQPDNRGDLIVFEADIQPPHPQAYLLARLVMKAAEGFGVRRIYTGAALASSISHMESPRVWGVATHGEIWAELENSGVEPFSEGHISGLNGLLLGIGKQMGFEGICLLGELPYYMIGTDSPKSSLAILEKLCLFWDVSVDASGLREASLRKEIEIEDFIRQGGKESLLEEMLKKGKPESDIPQ